MFDKTWTSQPYLEEKCLANEKLALSWQRELHSLPEVLVDFGGPTTCRLQTTQKQYTTQTSDLVRFFMLLCSTTFHVLGLFHCTVPNLFLYDAFFGNFILQQVVWSRLCRFYISDLIVCFVFIHLSNSVPYLVLF